MEGLFIKPKLELIDVEKFVFEIYGLKLIEMKPLESYDDTNVYIHVDPNIYQNTFIDKININGYTLKILNSQNTITQPIELQHRIMRKINDSGINTTLPILNINGEDSSIHSLPACGGGKDNFMVRLFNFIPGIPYKSINVTPALAYEVGCLAGKIDQSLKVQIDDSKIMIQITRSSREVPMITIRLIRCSVEVPRIIIRLIRSCRRVPKTKTRLLRSSDEARSALYKDYSLRYFLESLKLKKNIQKEDGMAYNVWNMAVIPDLLSSLHYINSEEDRDLLSTVIQMFTSKVLSKYNTLPKGFIHGDINEGNVLVSQTASPINNNAIVNKTKSWYKIEAIIDFGDISYSPYIFEISIAMLYLILQSKELDLEYIPSQVLKGYLQHLELSDEELSLIKLCVCARAVQSIVRGIISNSSQSNDSVGLELLKKLWPIPDSGIVKRWRYGSES